MNIQQLRDYLKKFPANMPVKLLHDSNIPATGIKTPPIHEFEEENMMVTSEGAWVDDEADPETWDTEDGKIRHKGRRYLLINPIIT